MAENKSSKFPLVACSVGVIIVAVAIGALFAIMQGSARTPYTVRWSGFIEDYCGYADEARQYVLGLHNLGVRIVTTQLQEIYDEDKVELKPEDKAIFDAIMVKKTKRLTDSTKYPQPIINVMHASPMFTRFPREAAYHICRTMFETESLPSGWARTLNLFDEIWVPTEFNVRTFRGAGVDKPIIHVLNEGINPSDFPLKGKKLDIPGARKFNFLSVFDWHRRKGWDVLIRTFRELFPEDGAGKDVALILKATGSPTAQIRIQMEQEFKLQGINMTIPSNIIIYKEYLSGRAFSRLYRTVDAYVMPSRGEGWGRPYMEAMLMGLPVIGTRYSGNLAFMNDSNSFLVNCSGLVKVDDLAAYEVYQFKDHYWCEPSKTHLAEQMKFVYDNPDAARAIGEVARRDIIENFHRDIIARQALALVEKAAARVMAHPELYHGVSEGVLPRVPDIHEITQYEL